jgi:thiol-disulfide isomerase/thioredoxin
MTIHSSRSWRHAAALVLGLAGLAAVGLAANGEKPAGRWDATVVVNGVEIPFRLDVTDSKAGVAGSFFNGDRTITSTSGTFEQDVLTLRFDQYAATLKATYRDGRLDGAYDRGSRGAYPFKAQRFTAGSMAAANAPAIAGEWTIGTKSPKGESAWRFIVRQDGGDVSASILRVDGDTGTLSGAFRDGRFVLSHFSGARPLLLEVTPVADGSLELLQNGKTRLVAVRADSARAKEVGAPTDPTEHTRVKDASERLRFSFADLNGRVVSDTDPRFQGKVVIVSITGSWCPNCHDEAPFLSTLYRKYKAKGLEIVAFSFEEAEQLANPTRLRAFIEQYGIDYTVLLAGEPDQLTDKVPQADNLNAFPTTFFLGRDGRVRGVHAGFPSPGSGSYYTQAEADITAQVEKLLAERAPGSY